MARSDFLLRVLYSYLSKQDKNCPYCHTLTTNLLARRKLLLQLRKCPKCKLMFRWPKDTADFNITFYQNRYYEKGLTTDLPDLAELKRLKEKNFSGTEKDFSLIVQVLKKLKIGGKLLDFGCSWGYSTYQFKQAGYEVTGFEISKPRAAFGKENLGLKIITDYSSLDNIHQNFDIIFSSHVLEHLPTLDGVFERFIRLLKQNGILMLLVPNCGGQSAKLHGVKWGPMINEKHTMALDATFFMTVLPRHHLRVKILTTDPYDPEKISNKMDSVVLNQDGDELMLIAVKTEDKLTTSIR